jgi:glycosyltransferase involved in cell wall biosynthesis
MPQLDIVLPVYNEEHVLSDSVGKLRAYLQENAFPYTWRIVIADNASTDGTLAAGEALASEFEDVTVIHLPQKGRGRALRKAWLESDADAACFMDIDLSTHLDGLLPLAKAVLEDGYDVSTGSRMTKGSEIKRSIGREITSHGFIFLIKVLFLTGLSDTQCGFKAISRQAAQDLIPRIENEEWFFDTELLLLADKGGYRVKDIPIRWLEDTDTRVNVPMTILEDLAGLLRMRFKRIPQKDN